MDKKSLFFKIGCISAFFAVISGAFGAHALKETLSENGTISTWDTAVRYQMWHALALIMLTLLHEYKLSKATGYCFISGTILFSGSLYGLALSGPKWLGPITPLGGLCLIAGWGLLAFSAKAVKER